MNLLIVKLSSLGDVVHAMPAVQDIRAALPQARIDWVVEPGFAPLVRRCAGLNRVLECPLRHWRKNLLQKSTRQQWQAFQAALQATAYDAVIDLQGLTKSALVAWSARLAPAGRRFALANRTQGSSYEAPTRWVADVAVAVPERSHALVRSRLLCAQALGYAFNQNSLDFGLYRHTGTGLDAIKTTAIEAKAGERPVVALVHGTSRTDKLWPEALWLALGQRLLQQGYALALPQGSESERERGERLAYRFGADAPVQVWPALTLDAVLDRLATCAGVIGVDSGLSHMAVALDLPHVQLYNFDTAWRTGPLPGVQQHQCSVYAQPHPGADSVWAAWQAVVRADA
ncbi:MAG: hypothetical protein RLZZ401_553 [Pseudomonadota bacterium]